MIITKKITKDNELYLYVNGKIIYKRWLNTGQSKVFDVMAYDKYTYASYKDLDVKDSDNCIEVKASLRLRTADEGGRKTGIRSGYVPNHVFEYRNDGKMVEAFMGDIQLLNLILLKPGKKHEVVVRFLMEQKIEKFMTIGRKWWIHEGSTVVGDAEIIDFEMPEA